MQSICAFLLIILVSVCGFTQSKDSVGDFTRSPTEHIINSIEKPFVVRLVRGVVIRKGGFREPLQDVLFEIQGPDGSKKIRRRRTNKHGEFKMSRVPQGTYRFKATLNGFQSVIGSITVNSQADKSTTIQLEMETGV